MDMFSHHFQDPEVPLFLLRNVCFFCDTNGIGALKTCFEKATPETLPFNFAHLLITLIANVSWYIIASELLNCLRIVKLGLKTCFEKATPETLPFNFAHLLITLIANVSYLRFSRF